MTWSEVIDNESRLAYCREKNRKSYARNRELIARRRAEVRARAKITSQPHMSFGRFLAYSKMTTEDLSFLLAKYELLKAFLNHQIELIRNEIKSRHNTPKDDQ